MALQDLLKSFVSPFIEKEQKKRQQQLIGTAPQDVVLPSDIAAGRTGVVVRNDTGTPSYAGELFDTRKPTPSKSLPTPPLSFGDNVTGLLDKLSGGGSTPNAQIDPSGSNGSFDKYRNNLNNNTSISGGNTNEYSFNNSTKSLLDFFSSGIDLPQTGSVDGGNGNINITSSVSNELDPDTERRINSRIDAMKQRIIQQGEELKAAARENNRMNRSAISGNLGLIFGENVDSSESSPVRVENDKLLQETKRIDTATAQALDELSTTRLDQLANALSSQRSAENESVQNQFDNIIKLAGLTGNVGGVQTLDARKAASDALDKEFKRRLDAGEFMSDQEAQQFKNYIDLQKLAIDQGKLDLDLDKFGIDVAGVTGTYNGSPTLDARNLDFKNRLAEAALLGQYTPEGGEASPTLAAQELLYKINNQGALDAGDISQNIRSGLSLLTQLEKERASLDESKLLYEGAGYDTSAIDEAIKRNIELSTQITGSLVSASQSGEKKND